MYYGDDDGEEDKDDISQLEKSEGRGSGSGGSGGKRKEQPEKHGAVLSVKQSKYEDDDDIKASLYREPALSSEAQAIARWTADLNDILARANAPMLNFLGALSVRLRLPDVRYTMAWNSAEPDPRERVKHLVRPASTVREWISQS